jgi:hypothetical protein
MFDFGSGVALGFICGALVMFGVVICCIYKE